MKAMKLFLSFSLILNAFPVFGQSVKVEEEKYFVSPGDVISINVFPATEFSREVTVQADGTVEVPLLGAIKVQGYTAEDIRKILTARFSKYVANPQITVNVRKFATSRLGVMGEVKRPGYYPFVEGMRLLDLITQAGGFGDYAKLGKAKVFRKVKDPQGNYKEELISVDLEKVVEGDFRYNIELASGDIVYVPKNDFSKFTRWMSDNIVPWLSLAILGLLVEDRLSR